MPIPATVDRAARDSINANIRQGVIDRHTGNQMLFWDLPAISRDISRWQRVGTDPAGITAELTAATTAGDADDPLTPKQAATAAMRLAVWETERPAYEQYLTEHRFDIQVTVALNRRAETTRARQDRQDDALNALGWGEVGPLATEDYPGELDDLRDLVGHLRVAAGDRDRLAARTADLLDYHGDRARRLWTRALTARQQAAGHDDLGDDCTCTVCQPTTT